jgi:hypothetical protein
VFDVKNEPEEKSDKPKWEGANYPVLEKPEEKFRTPSGYRNIIPDEIDLNPNADEDKEVADD